MTFQRIVELDELWENEMRGYVVGRTRLLLVRLPGAVCAYEDRCAHLGLALHDGDLTDEVITCRAHHYRYDARTGRGVNPKSARLRSYPVRVDQGVISVDVSAAGAGQELP
jgi:toluene monooxygenase system ferredoxin subunit